jgi:hypothetical protein
MYRVQLLNPPLWQLFCKSGKISVIFKFLDAKSTGSIHLCMTELFPNKSQPASSMSSITLLNNLLFFVMVSLGRNAIMTFTTIETAVFINIQKSLVNTAGLVVPEGTVWDARGQHLRRQELRAVRHAPILSCHGILHRHNVMTSSSKAISISGLTALHQLHLLSWRRSSEAPWTCWGSGRRGTPRAAMMLPSRAMLFLCGPFS